MKMRTMLGLIVLVGLCCTAVQAEYIDYSHTIWDYDATSCWLSPSSPEPRRGFGTSEQYGSNQRMCYVVDGSGMHDGNGNPTFDGPYHDNCSTLGRSVWHTRNVMSVPTPSGVAGAATYAAWDFAAVFELGVMDVWNFNYNVSGTDLTSRGFKNVRIHYRASEEDPWTELLGTAGDTHWDDVAGNWVFEKATGEVNYAANTHIDFGGVEAQYVVLTALDQWGTSPQYTGLSEVRFDGVEVPEPMTCTLLCVGGLIALRRRR